VKIDVLRRRITYSASASRMYAGFGTSRGYRGQTPDQQKMVIDHF